MDLTELRGQIDAIDDELVRLFRARMDIAAQVADYKKAHGLPIYMPAREREKLQDVRCDLLLAADPGKGRLSHVRPPRPHGTDP